MSHRLSSVAELTLAVPRSVCGVIPEARDWYGNALTSANASSINCRCRLDRERCSQPRAALIRNRAGTVMAVIPRRDEGGLCPDISASAHRMTGCTFLTFVRRRF